MMRLCETESDKSTRQEPRFRFAGKDVAREGIDDGTVVGQRTNDDPSLSRVGGWVVVPEEWKLEAAQQQQQQQQDQDQDQNQDQDPKVPAMAKTGR
ncbi:hypothetical protein GE21DRAFT_1333481 [Neurospora crassa]|nr:hypothetical protein GE21DRAFT_1333481 [Neurospora crassa]